MRNPFFLPLLVALCLTACGRTVHTADTMVDPSTTYSLIAIDGHALPYAPSHEGRTGPVVQASTLTLKADSTFVSTGTYGVPSGRTVTRDFSGTYTRMGAVLTLRWDGAGQTTATLDGDSFTMVNEGIRFTYRR